jgi:hypothetical protein
MRTASQALEELLSDTGALLAARGDRVVVAHYGSAAAELAVCVSAVGLVWRGDLSVLNIAAPADRLDALLRRAADAHLAPGGAVQVEDVWWCRSQAGEALTLLCPASALPRVLSTSLANCPYLGVTIDARISDTVALALVGRRAWELLALLGVCDGDGDVRGVAPFSCGEIAGSPVRWLIESPQLALALVGADCACELWRAIEIAGRPLGLSRVGHDALERFLVARRIERERR